MKHNHLLLIHAPGWSTQGIPYALSLVAGIVEYAGWSITVLDLNNILYNSASPETKQQWENNAFWFDRTATTAYIEQNKTRILQEFENIDLAGTKYDLIGFSVNSYNRISSLTVGALAKSQGQARAPILFGGPDCFPNEFYKNYFTNDIFSPDCLLCGEAEVAFVNFLKEFKKTKSIQTAIPGFLYPDGDRLIDNGRPELPELKESTIAAIYTPFAMAGYPSELWIASSRGCINHCNFCNEHVNFTRYRKRNSKVIGREIKNYAAALHKAGIKESFDISFADSIINADPRHCDSVIDILLSFRDHIRKWSAQAAFRVPLTDAMLVRMQMSKCHSLFWGFESGAQSVIDLMGKKYLLQDAVRTMKQAGEHGITNNLPLVVGFPGEDTSDLLATLTFLVTFKNEPYINFIYSSVLEIKQGSPLHRNLEAFCVHYAGQHDWHTGDGLNDFNVRQFRQGILGMALFATGGAQTGDDDASGYDSALRASAHALYAADFNTVPLARETYVFLAGLCKMLDQTEGFVQFINTLRDTILDARVLLQTPSFISPGHAPMLDNAFYLWTAIDKNACRDKIIRFISDLLHRYTEKCAASALFSITLLAQKPTYLQVFYNNNAAEGYCFDEEHSLRQTLVAGKTQEYFFLIPRDRISALRVDFGDVTQHLAILRCSLSHAFSQYFSVTGKDIPGIFPTNHQIQFDEAAPEHGGKALSVQTCGTDPFMLYEPLSAPAGCSAGA